MKHFNSFLLIIFCFFLGLNTTLNAQEYAIGADLSFLKASEDLLVGTRRYAWPIPLFPGLF